MKHALLSVVALILVTASTVAPAFANGSAQGKYMTVAVESLPDVCPAGQTMVGKLVVTLSPDDTRVTRLVTARISLETPFGDLPLYKMTFRMAPGTSHSEEILIPVPRKTPLGEYYFNFDVSVKEEALTVGHEVLVVRGR